MHDPWVAHAHTMAGTLWVASNTFEEADGLGQQHGGRANQSLREHVNMLHMQPT
jgi:hypothetical protein